MPTSSVTSPTTIPTAAANSISKARTTAIRPAVFRPKMNRENPLGSANSPFRDGVPPVPDVANTGRNIWDVTHDAGLSLRNYGFFLYITDKNVGVSTGPDNYPVAPGLQPPGHDLAGITDIDYRRFDLDYPDSDAPNFYFKQTGDKQSLFKKTSYGQFESPSRFAEWNREFQMMLAADPTAKRSQP